jgi:hypothetical protein
MQLPEIAHYFEEMARVLTPDGFGVATFRSVQPGETPPPARGREWVPVGDGVYTVFPETPGRSLAYDDALIRATIANAGVEIVAFVEGRWHGNPPAESAGPALGADVYIVKARSTHSAPA